MGMNWLANLFATFSLIYCCSIQIEFCNDWWREKGSNLFEFLAFSYGRHFYSLKYISIAAAGHTNLTNFYKFDQISKFQPKQHVRHNSTILPKFCNSAKI